MITDEHATPSGRTVQEPDCHEEAAALESLVQAGFRLIHVGGPQDAPTSLTYERHRGSADFVFIALDRGASSMANRYPATVELATFAEASGEEPPTPLAQAKPGTLLEVIAEVHRWPRGEV
ncbi:hypothetical protein [Amycolatopsis samaneae]|uniref:Uncharacterized protein n=1 Tax=Amycolatopsis samaneae TaxID=664691 RepID=A0ABW5GKK7_9PSEU